MSYPFDRFAALAQVARTGGVKCGVNCAQFGASPFSPVAKAPRPAWTSRHL
ncbi:hypothetical protein SAMN05518801_103130 [Novosphingobium sp. CF614]|uniref:hypothetical protein n=1 Tax=Novosphingobium sp. CF614 TaxID=1884364 RepID=UPI0008F05B3E|nr:hypothetical protein [Novosphingobium sp. CF614]SFF91332.1 hypothetical protein SAMN05518801_103130 [Novosphingobium sp. CF614]